ncbi:LAT2 domain-containing protein [Entelurus aequoreus]|uniref:LAT2 domain-containing protein n=1 Tax=Entelurus aequoreus TaxID=161455 RepID=UPI002B1E7CB9|nr:LAT2 domain-containing protein [Entelurus aequoreus]
MLGNFSVQCALPTAASLSLLSLLCLLCLRCKKKSKTIHEETQVYDTQTFHRGGSRFAVVRSKTVTRVNQMTPRDSNADCYSAVYLNDASPSRSWEHIYVNPLPMPVYENDARTKDAHQLLMGDYENVPAAAPKSDDDDYENSEFLAQTAQGGEDTLATCALFL